MGVELQKQLIQTCNSFRTNFFGHTVETIAKGFSNVLGSRHNDHINGDDKDNVLIGFAGNDSIQGGSGDDKILLGEGDDLVQGDAGDDRIDGGQGIDTAIYTGNTDDYAVRRLKHVVTVQDQRKDTSEGTDQIENVESFKFNDGEIKLEELNKGPVLTGEKTRFENGQEDENYLITKEELLGDLAMKMKTRSILHLWGKQGATQ